MGACRQSQDLFYHWKTKKYKRFWYLIRHYDKTTHEDTWMPIVCKYKGHKYYKTEDSEWACRRCNRYVEWSDQKDKMLKLNKKLKKIKK